jgi:hypothetical protein
MKTWLPFWQANLSLAALWLAEAAAVVIWDLFSPIAIKTCSNLARQSQFDWNSLQPVGRANDNFLIVKCVEVCRSELGRLDLHAMTAEKKLTMWDSIGILLDDWRCVGDDESFQPWEHFTSTNPFLWKCLLYVDHTSHLHESSRLTQCLICKLAKIHKKCCTSQCDSQSYDFLWWEWLDYLKIMRLSESLDGHQ